MTFDEHPKAGGRGADMTTKGASESASEATQKAGGNVITKGGETTEGATPRAGGNVITKGPSQAEPESEERAGGNVITKGESRVEPSDETAKTAGQS